VGLRVGVDAHDRPRRRGQHVGPVALAAGQVDDVEPRDAPCDPLVDDQVAPEPVVLLGHVGERALAGQLERRHAGRLVALHIGVGHGGRA
jgi:hypothetical protein